MRYDPRDLLVRRTLVRWTTDCPRIVLPDRRLIQVRFESTHIHEYVVLHGQYDCGKLQVLETLLRRRRDEGHRVLIFTQMARMLDILVHTMLP